MDVDAFEVEECETGVPRMSLPEESDSNVAAEASPPIPASSSPHTEPPTPVDAETQPDEELSDEEGESNDEENTSKSAGRHANNNAAGDRRVDEQYKELTSVIAAHQKRLRNKKTMLTDSKAATTILELEALQNYNKLQYTLHLQIRKQRAKLAAASPRLRYLLQNKMRIIRPAMEASERVAENRSKSSTYARRLREQARYLLRTGELLENDQGKGANHETLLSRPSVVQALRRWVNGLVPSDEGGFEGQVMYYILFSHSYV
jgi:hypothetical protein